MPRTALTFALLLWVSSAQAGTATVTFDHPERYADAGPLRQAESVRSALRQHLDALAGTGLPAGQSLAITITDIDLAGEIPLGDMRLHDVRVMGRQPDWPRISLHYTLRNGEQVLAQGSEQVSDMAYLMHQATSGDNGVLPYERRMLSAWFAQRFGSAKH